MLAFGTQVRGFKPGRSRQIFQGEKKILSTPPFRREVKRFVPCRRFTAYKRSLKCYVEGNFTKLVLIHTTNAVMLHIISFGKLGAKYVKVMGLIRYTNFILRFQLRST